MSGPWIFYMIDTFSRFRLGQFIPNKEGATIVAMLINAWIKMFGTPETLHSDQGEEFLNKEIEHLCDTMNIKYTFTASKTPNANGIMERNNFVTDLMLFKIMAADTNLKHNPDIALSWALAASNSLENVGGRSPCHIVFGQNPNIPTLQTVGPPGYEEVDPNSAIANHISAMHLAREEYVKAENDKVLRCLKKR